MPGTTATDQYHLVSSTSRQRLKPLKVWIYHDDRAGHISQLKGLINALAQDVQIEQHWIEARSLRFKLHTLVSPNRQSTSPDIVIGAGHKTHRSLLLTAREHKAVSFVIMKPSLPLRFFDGLICPQHDGLRNSDNVFNTQGPITKIPPVNQESEQTTRDKHLIVLGGPSKHFDWDDAALVQQLRAICQARPEIQWYLSDSPRTPKDFLEKLQNKPIQNLECHHYQNRTFGDLGTELRTSAFTWITPDSMSMIYESLTAGSPTALLSLAPAKGAARKRICRHVEEILTKGLVMGFDKWTSCYHKTFYPPGAPALNEAKAAAQWLLARYKQLRSH